MADVYVPGVRMTLSGKHCETSCSEFSESAAVLAFEDASIEVKDLDVTIPGRM